MGILIVWALAVVLWLRNMQGATATAPSSGNLPFISNVVDPSVNKPKGVDYRKAVSGVMVDANLQGMDRLIAILKQQSDKPKEERRLFEPITLPDLSAYQQPREIHELVKEQYKKAEWQPKEG